MKNEVESLHFDHISAAAVAFPKKTTKKRFFYLCPNTSGCCKNAAGRREPKLTHITVFGCQRLKELKKLGCGGSAVTAGVHGTALQPLAHLVSSAQKRRSHSSGEHLLIRFHWILIPLRIRMDTTAVHGPQQLWSDFYIYCLFKNFHERFETGLLSSVTALISSACWVILFRLSRCITSRSKRTWSLLQQITQFTKMIICSLSFHSHYLFLHLFPL